ncbi:hypothetical protein M3J09_004374 [Ascochyta lentis]
MIRTRFSKSGFFAGADPELCDHTPPLLFLHSKECCVGVLATHALNLSSVSLSPRSLTPDPLQRIPGTLHFPLHARRRARSSRGLPVGPGPSCVRDRGCNAETQACVLCTNRQYVDMIRSLAALPNFLFGFCPFLIPPALWLYRKTRCGCCWGEKGVGVLTGNERYVFPPAHPISCALRGALGCGRQMLLKVDIFVFVCTAGFVYE